MMRMHDDACMHTDQTGRAGAKHQRAGPQPRADLVQPVAGTRRGLDQRRLHVAQVVDLEDLGLRIRAVLGEAAAQVDAVAGPLPVLCPRVLLFSYRCFFVRWSICIVVENVEKKETKKEGEEGEEEGG